MPLLHEEARPVYLGHAEGELAVQHNINAQEAVRDHEQQAIVSRSCTQHSKAIGGQGPARKRTGTGWKALMPISISVGRSIAPGVASYYNCTVQL